MTRRTKKYSRFYDKETKKALCKKYIGDFFEQFTVYFKPWLRELTYGYKSRCMFPTMAVTILPSYYSDALDKEVAALLTLLVKDDERVAEHCREFRLMAGDHPYDWFMNRGFVRLCLGGGQNKITGGARHWKISNLMDDLWESRRRTGGYDFSILKHHVIDENNIRLLKMALGTSDGIGMGIADIDESEMLCPFTADGERMLGLFFPNWKMYGSMDEAVKLFCLDRDYDFFYSSLAYKELERRNPKECARLVTLYQKWYNDRNLHVKTSYWTGSERVLPVLD